LNTSFEFRVSSFKFEVSGLLINSNSELGTSNSKLALLAFRLWDERNQSSLFECMTLDDALCFHDELRSTRHP
jgi:hypothetical protein